MRLDKQGGGQEVSEILELLEEEEKQGLEWVELRDYVGRVVGEWGLLGAKQEEVEIAVKGMLLHRAHREQQERELIYRELRVIGGRYFGDRGLIRKLTLPESEVEIEVEPERLARIPSELWQACWREDYFDFSEAAWEREEVEQQIEYARAYQEWYAARMGEPVEKRWVRGGIEMVMRLIPPGRLWMGSPESEKKRDDNDEQRHRVVLSRAYWLGKYEVTQREWQAVMGSNPSRFQGKELPVEMVSWENCQEFAGKTGLRLPTEAEWEYACRAGTTTPFNLGENITPNDNGEYRGRTVKVGSLGSPNAWGCHDMHGNVWEWCQDWYGEYPLEEQCNPPGPNNGSDRVVRGGGFVIFARYCRSAFRAYDAPEHRDRDLGVRLGASSQP